jgi:hypothetical protein
MNATIEAMKADALRQIRANRPQMSEDGKYACPFCGGSGEGRGWQMWHNCPQRAAQGIKLRVVRRGVV